MKYHYMTTRKVSKCVDDLGAVRFDGQRWWYLNHRCKGWASFGYHYPTLSALLRHWNLELEGQQEDEFGLYYPISRKSGEGE